MAGEATLMAKPIVRLLRELGNTPLRKKFRRDTLRSGFFGDGFGTVFTIFVGSAMAGGIGPGTAGTIDSVALIQAIERGDATQDTWAFEGMLQSLGNRL
jgi:hypothetical protein